MDRLLAMEAFVRVVDAGSFSTAAPRGPLRVTAPPGFASHYLDVMTRDFLARFPEATLDLTHRMVDLVEENVDVAIRVTDPRDSSLVARRIAPAPIIAVAAPSYLRRRGAPKIPADLRDHDCLVDTNFRDQQRWRFRSRDKSKMETIPIFNLALASIPALFLTVLSTRALAGQLAGQLAER